MLTEELKTDEKRQKLACANYLSIDQKHISNVEIDTDGGGHFTGLKVTIFIPTGRGVKEWIDSNIPE